MNPMMVIGIHQQVNHQLTKSNEEILTVQPPYNKMFIIVYYFNIHDYDLIEGNHLIYIAYVILSQLYTKDNYFLKTWLQVLSAYFLKTT